MQTPAGWKTENLQEHNTVPIEGEMTGSQHNATLIPIRVLGATNYNNKSQVKPLALQRVQEQ